VLDGPSLPPYSQKSIGDERNSPTIPLYPEVNGTLEKAMPASTISDSSESSIPNSIESESGESTSYEPLYKSRINHRYDRYARRWGFDDKKTKEENIDSVTKKADALQEQLDWKYPNNEEEIELEEANKLIEILPKIITSLMPIKMENNPQQEEWSFRNISPTCQMKNK